MKTSVHARALVLRPAGETLAHALGERLDQAGSVVVAGHVLELDLGAVEIEAVGDALLVPARPTAS